MQDRKYVTENEQIFLTSVIIMRTKNKEVIMTEEIKNEATEETKTCKCCERCEKIAEGVKEFAFKAGIVYVGVTLAILTSATLLKPKHHHMPPCRPAIQRQLPPPPMVQNDFGLRQGRRHFAKEFGHRQHARKMNKEFREQKPPVDKK